MVANVTRLAETLCSKAGLLSSGATGESRALLSETGSVAVGVSLGEPRARAVALLVVVALDISEVVATGEASRALIVPLGTLLEASLKTTSTLPIAGSSAKAAVAQTYGSNGSTESRANADSSDGDPAIAAADYWANPASVATTVAASVASSDKTTAALDLLVLLAGVCGGILLGVLSEGKTGHCGQHSEAQGLQTVRAYLSKLVTMVMT